ncbi:MAG TPA: helix-turn-helix transcriptional regulator [Anaeromyxobacteraceae bacterium]|nr:helix-turn-helix transcriptional regulator [Anaeromyxobacteraceae bacterium]
MGHKFSDFMKELEEETRREGPEAVAEAAALDAQFKLAAELILLRRQRGLTQRQLSARSGVQQSEISRIEGGRANPTAATLTALARALNSELRILPARVRNGRSVRVSGTGSARTGTAARRLVPRAARRSGA